MPSFRNRRIDVVLDVRTRLEYWLGHLPGAVRIPVDDLEREVPKRGDLRPDQAILVYCASGARSARAAAALRRMGFTRVTDAGGIAEARAGFTPE